MPPTAHQSAVLLAWLFAAAALAADAPALRVYDLPPGSRPHDVAPAPDGRVWYTAQRRGALGILDPAGGQVQEVPLGV